jgi:hypothetical protein
MKVKLFRKYLSEEEREHYRRYLRMTFHPDASHLVSISVKFAGNTYSTDVMEIIPKQLRFAYEEQVKAIRDLIKSESPN